MSDELPQWPYLKGMEERLSTLITNVKDSLEREIHATNDNLTTRFDAQSIRLDRQAALIQTGSRMGTWAERIDI